MKNLIKRGLVLLLTSLIWSTSIFAAESSAGETDVPTIAAESEADTAEAPAEEVQTPAVSAEYETDIETINTEHKNNIKTEDTEFGNNKTSTEALLIESSSASDSEHLTRDFVTRLYETLLLRSPDEDGLNDWTLQLMSGAKTGSDIICGFLFSDEFQKQNYSDTAYVELLYHALFDRSPDQAGFDSWIQNLNEGLSRTYVCAGFIDSNEFHKLCNRFQISPGHLEVTSIIDKNPDIVHFVNYLYTYILSRNYDKSGLEDWVTRLSTHQETAAQVVYGFIFSNEFQKKNLSNESYISILYQTILDRNPDTAGLSDWCDALNHGMSRLFVLQGFIESSEFSKLCQKYKITAGTIELSEARDMKRSTTKYIYICLKNCLNREASVNELNTWSSKINSGTSTLALFLETLLFSPESGTSTMSDPQFIHQLYITILHRVPSEDETNTCLTLLSAKTRKEIFSDIVTSTEFSDLANSYNLAMKIYQNPSQYYQVQYYIPPLTGGDYNLSKGFEGLKVAKVIEKLNINNGNYIGMSTKAEYTAKVVSAVKSFQQNNGLSATGIVDLETWLKMGFTESDWYTLGSYVSPLKTTAASTREDYIEAMIERAYEYLDTPYVVGASGQPGQGVDCSGLVMQALYSAGIDLSPINPVRHSHPGYEYESANMWASSKFKKVSYAQRQRGDLIIYQNSQGTVIHVAIYLGNDQVIESMVPSNKVIVAPIKNAYRSNIKGVLRPFI